MHEKSHEAFVGCAQPGLHGKKPGWGKSRIADSSGLVLTLNPCHEIRHIHTKASFIGTPVKLSEYPAPEPLGQFPADSVYFKCYLASSRSRKGGSAEWSKAGSGNQISFPWPKTVRLFSSLPRLYPRFSCNPPG